MAKKSRAPLPEKTARDRAIDKALLIASRQPSPPKGGTILISRSDVKGRAHTAAAPPPAQAAAKAKPAKPSVEMPTAMALALKQAGLGPAADASAPPRPSPPPVATAPPSGAKAAAPPAPSPRKQKTKKAKLASKITAPAKPVRKPKAGGKRLKGFPASTSHAAADAQGRKARMQARYQEAAGIIADIGRLPPDDLLALWRKHVLAAQSEQSAFRELADSYVEAIEGEWRRRAILARLDPDHFDWPSTQATPGNGAFGSIDHAEGILGYLGYHVGKTGEASSARRQALLSRAFEGPLPPINGPDYMDEWGRPNTPARLRKMAESIASAVRSAKRRSHADYSVAIEHWEEDLRFLHDSYYVHRFSFHWPGMV